MQVDPVSEWQRLTDQYRRMSDEELSELAEDFADLTESAQQVLRSEMRSRGLGNPESARTAPALQPASTQATPASVALRNAPSNPVDDVAFGGFGSAFGTAFAGRAPQLVPDTPDAEDDSAAPHEYTWKTELCELDTSEEAMQLQEVLKRAGIECWFNFEGNTTPYVPSIARSVTFGGIQVLVAADQLEHARAIAAQPIPQDIIDDSKLEVPDYEMQQCPKCGAEDPILESVEPANHWHCENCGADWSDPAEIAGIDLGKETGQAP